MWSELVLTVVPLLVIVDPLASIGLCLSLTHRSAVHPAWVALKAALFAAVVLVGVAFGGARALDLLGIKLYSLRVAGGILLVFIGVNMLKEGEDITSLPTGGRYLTQPEDPALPQGQTPRAPRPAEPPDPSLVPLGLPMLAGPGAISLVIVQSTTYHRWVIVLAILLTMLVSLVILLVTGQFGKRLIGENGQRVLTRLMGLVMVAFAVQYVFSGLDEWLVSRSVRAATVERPCVAYVGDVFIVPFPSCGGHAFSDAWPESRAGGAGGRAYPPAASGCPTCSHRAPQRRG